MPIYQTFIQSCEDCPVGIEMVGNETYNEIDQQKRKNILNEIYETEKTYQHHLKLLTTIFLEPVKFSAILPPKIIDGLFSNIEAIHSVSSRLLQSMEEHGVVHSLLELAPYMKLYSIYANNFNTSAKLLAELQNRSDDFTRLLKFQEAREEMESLKLSSLLVTPIQRVPRYRLLLENLLEKTRPDDPVLPKLKWAYEEIAKVTTHINECVRQHENFDKMLEIQNCFSGANVPQVLSPGRFFIREGVVTSVSKKGKAKERTLFLFNDLLICARKESSNMYQSTDVYTLFNCIVEQLLGSSDDGNGLFKVISADKYLLLCTKRGESPWADDIKNAITKLHENVSSLRRGTSLRRGSFVLSASRYENRKTKKVTTPKKTVNGSFHYNVGNSPVLNVVSNRASTKRNTLLMDTPISVFDICRNSELDIINTSLNSVSSFLKNNSFLFNSTETEEIGEAYPVPDLEEPKEFEDNHIPKVNWTVTEKSATAESTPSRELKISCAGKRKDDGGNVSPPYTKKANFELEDIESEPLNYDGSEKIVAAHIKKPVMNDAATNCSLM